MIRWLGLLLLCAAATGAEIFRDDFSTAKTGALLPPNWNRYGTRNETNFTQIVLKDGRPSVRIVDLSQKETGVCRDFKVTPGKYYRAKVVLSPFDKDAPRKDIIRLQLRFDLGGGKARIFGGAVAPDGETAYDGQAPEGVKFLRIYIYTSFEARLDLLLRSFTLEESDAPFSVANGDVKQGFVPPVPKLKDLCRETPLDRVTIQTSDRYRALADRLADALEKKTGRRPAVVSDAEEKVSGHRILLGNRDTNRIIDGLYRKYFAFTDMTYPGAGGYELRTVHDPFGDKVNYVIAGGSDDAGVQEAVSRLIARPEKILPPVIDVRTALPPPKDIPSTQYWTRMGSGFPGYGWNTLDWLLELYYRTGDAKYAREFIRLGLHPTPADVPMLKKLNAESFWDCSQPLSTPYHYMGHYIVLLWDLVEEQDVFSDAERLAVTRALAKQITHPDINMRYRTDVDSLPPAERVGDRHAQWSVMMMYVLARYMDRDYPHPVWKNVLKSAEYFHAPMLRPGTWGAPSSNFGWYASSMLNETAQYLVMTGQTPHPEGMLMTAAKVYEILWEPGIRSAINETMSAHNHRLLGALTGDGKYYFYAADIDRKSATMKLGQSFMSVRDRARVPEETVGKWLVAPMPPAGCRHFGMKEPFDGLTLNTGYRDTLEAGVGDRVMFDLFNELGRAPYQLNSLCMLRVGSLDYLSGYVNYLQVRKNGAASRHIPIAARLRGTGVTGDFAFHTSAVPDMAHAEWERTLLLKKRHAALIVDRLTARADGPLEAVLSWQTAQPPSAVQGNRILQQQATELRASDTEVAADGPVKPESSSRVAHLKKAGDTFRLTFTLKKPFDGNLSIRLVQRADGAPGVSAALDGKVLRRGLDASTAGADVARLYGLGRVSLSAGKHTLTLTLTKPSPGEYSAVALWRIAFAPDVNAAVIAGAGMAAGRDYHVGKTPDLKAGGSHSFFTVCAAGAEAETVPGNPNAALLKLPEKVLVFAGRFAPFGEGRVVWVDEKETAVLSDKFALSVRPTSVEAKTALAALRGAPYQARQPENVAAVQPAAIAETGWSAALMAPVTFRGEPAVFAGLAGRAAVVSPKSGSVLLELKFPGRMLSLHATDKLLLVGTVEDKLYAFDHNGKLLWTHTSLCATPPEKQKHYYWYKGAYPGVYAVSSLDGAIFTGGACTVEQLDMKGQVVRRYEQFWGPVTWLAPFTVGGAPKMLSARLRICHSAQLYEVDPVKLTSRSVFDCNPAGWRDFPGFCAMRRTQVVPADVTGDGKPEMVAASCGMYTWINLYGNDGKPLAQVNLGGRPQLSGLAAGRDIVAAVDPMRHLTVFDGKLNVKVCRELDREPLDARMIGERIGVLDNAGVTLFDREGRACRRLTAPGARRMLLLSDGTLAVADGKGKIAFFSASAMK